MQVDTLEGFGKTKRSTNFPRGVITGLGVSNLQNVTKPFQTLETKLILTRRMLSVVRGLCFPPFPSPHGMILSLAPQDVTLFGNRVFVALTFQINLPVTPSAKDGFTRE